MMQPVFFSSGINVKYKSELEEILFFNKRQKEYLQDINNSIESYGLPKIIQEGNSLKIRVEHLKDVQTIYAFDSNESDAALLGLILYYRISVDEIIVLHIAIVDECTAEGSYSKEFVVLRLINKLKENAKRIKGVEKIRISYTGDFNNFTLIKIKNSLKE